MPASSRRLVLALALMLSPVGRAAADPVPVTVGTVGNEPLIAVAPDHTVVISALQHLYASTDGGATFFAVTGPPFAEQANLNSDSSIHFDPDGRLYFTFDWPYAGSTAVCTAESPIAPTPAWTSNPEAFPGLTDRMWIIAPTTSVAYAVTNEGLYETTFFVSTDHGLTWAPRAVGAGLLEPQTGPLLTPPTSAEVFQVAKNGGELGFYVYDTADTTQPVAEYRGTAVPAPLALPSGAFSREGTLWAASEAPNAVGGSQVAVVRSGDRGISWTRLPDLPGGESGTAIFTWLAAGAPGHVGVIFYWTPSIGDPGTLTNATWDVRYAETFDGDAPAPHWNVFTVESGIHTGAICIAASCSGSNRFAGDFIGSQIDADEVSHLAWMRDTGGSKIRYLRYQGSPVAVEPSLTPTGHWLGAAVPNPARDGTAFRFGLARPTPVSLVIHDPGGRRVRTLAAGWMSAGVHEARWDGRDDRGRLAPSGLYFARLEVEGRLLISRVAALR